MNRTDISQSTIILSHSLKEAIEIFPSGVFILDEHGIIVELNKAALDVIGSDRNGIIETSFVNLIEENQKNRFQNFLDKSLKSIGIEKAEFSIVCNNESYIDTLSLAKCLKDDESGKNLYSITLVDITHYKIQEELTKESHTRFENIANTAPVMIWMTGVDGLFTFVNQVWLDFTGNELGDNFGLNWVKNIHPDDLEKFLGHYQKALKSKTPFTCGFRFKRKDDVYRWIIINGIPRFNKENIFVGFIGSCTDMNDQKEAEEKIRKVNTELTELIATKDKFFSIISHDLRSPLGGLITLLDLIATSYDSFSDDEKLDLIKEAAKSSQNTYTLMENLLEWSRVQTGNMSYRPELFEIFPMIESLESLYDQNLKNKGITFKIDVDPDSSVYADQKILDTIIRNLISNAIKFTRTEGTITVSSIAGEGSIIILVKDNGVGIKPDDLDKLFKVDVSHSTRGTEDETGTGLGLILCKELVENQKGEIWVESKINEGSTFFFTLPTDK